MAHAPPGRRGLTGDEANNGLRHLLANELRGLLFVGATDLAHHRNGLGLRVLLERRQAVDEIRPIDRIAADANARRLPEAGTSELIDDLIRQRTRTTHHADVARRANTARNDSDLRFSRRDQSGTVRADEPGASLPDERIDLRHVQ